MPVDIYMNEKLTRQRLTTSVNRIGGTGETWGDDLDFYGRIRPLSAEKRLSADRQTIACTHKLYCSVIDITAKDRVTDGAGNFYRVIGVIDSMSEGEFLTCELLFIEHDQETEDKEPDPEPGEGGEENGDAEEGQENGEV